MKASTIFTFEFKTTVPHLLIHLLGIELGMFILPPNVILRPGIILHLAGAAAMQHVTGGEQGEDISSLWFPCWLMGKYGLINKGYVIRIDKG